MNLALISVSALTLAVLISCVSRLNVGVLSVALAWIVGVYIGGLPVNTVMSGFPSQLFLTLAGVTLLFAMAQSNGTLGQLTHHAVRLCRGNAGTIPIMFFLLGAALSSMGPGNIATAALLTPIAMATATRAGIPLFLMAIMVGNGANSGSLSPFAPTGIIVNGIMAKNQMPGLEMQAYLYNFAAHALMAFLGYAIFGGLRLFAADRTVEAALGGRVFRPGVDSKAFTSKQWITLGVLAALIISVLAFKAHVGLAAFVAAVLLVAARAADDGEAIKLMPWRVIVMVCGVTVLIALVERFQGLDLMVSLVAKLSSPGTVTFVVALLTGIVSVYSSTSGVVLPAFLPLVPGLAAQLPGASAVGIAMSMNIGGHLVDVSPLSTIGALCIASAGLTDTRKLFNQLLAWGLSMAVLGAVLSYLLF
jgi:Na+/H+ antiporter NhaD/arsenite permease-like protein